MLNTSLTWSFCEEAAIDSPLVASAREAARELAITTSSPATARFVQALAASNGVKNVAEIGTGTGVLSVAVVEGCPEASLTSIDTDAEAHVVARSLLRDAGISSSKLRLIHGAASDILPRLASASYDMVIVDGDPLDAPEDTHEAIRLLRSGGVLVVPRALQGDKVADPVRREEATALMRGLVKSLLADETIITSLLPLGEGILLAVKR